MKTFDTLCGWIVFGLVLAVTLVSPWFFGAWEVWWFWPPTVGIFAATALLGLRLLLAVQLGTQHLNLAPAAKRLTLFYAPFLLYALVRALQADVYMDAERSFLLQFTPVLLGAIVIFSFTEKQLRVLTALLALDFFLLGAYGIGNHYLTGNAKVLWMPGFARYQEPYHRATGSYYCPDHFSGVMEMALALGLGLMLARETSRLRKIAAVPLIAAALWAIFCTKSRGGGLTVGMVLAFALWWGLTQWRPWVRWTVRAAAVAALVAAAAVTVSLGSHYVQRFRAYPWREYEKWDRYQLAATALRAWHSAPTFGIGPGMHQNLWPHFAPSPDGNPEKGIWPSVLNDSFRVYEVHDDWVQLLEEYGTAGMLLFLVAVGGVGWTLIGGWRRETADRRAAGWQPTGRRDYGTLLAALLAGVALAFHSLGDFNLQMPATTWLLAVIVAVPVAFVTLGTRYAPLRIAWGKRLREPSVMFVVVSDLHLGSRHCRSDLLARFLDDLPAEATLILNGDTVDYRRRRMNADHTAVLDRLIAMSATRRVVWLYGNHDEGYRPQNAGALEFAPDLAIGKRLLIQHGSYFDKVMPHHRIFIFAFRVMHYLRVRLGAEAMHVAQYAKKWDRLYRVVRRSVMLNAVAHAKAHGYAAVTCGHTHFAEDVVVDGIRYINTGSWTELPVHYLLIDDTQLRLERYEDPRPIQTAAG